jgi:hypothetical protein
MEHGVKCHGLRTIVLLAALAFTITIARADDPLPSWNDGLVKQSSIAFVEKSTKVGSPDFLPMREHIAVYDNDGTLWCKKPILAIPIVGVKVDPYPAQ